MELYRLEPFAVWSVRDRIGVSECIFPLCDRLISILVSPNIALVESPLKLSSKSRSFSTNICAFLLLMLSHLTHMIIKLTQGKKSKSAKWKMEAMAR
jgi:hypothetical protein